MGIDEVESLPHQRFFVVENHAVKIDKRLWIDKDADFFKVVHTIAFPRLRVEANVVRKTRAATALDAQTKSPLFRGDPFFGHSDSNPLEGAFGDLNALLIRRCVFRVEDG